MKYQYPAGRSTLRTFICYVTGHCWIVAFCGAVLQYILAIALLLTTVRTRSLHCREDLSFFLQHADWRIVSPGSVMLVIQSWRRIVSPVSMMLVIQELVRPYLPIRGGLRLYCRACWLERPWARWRDLRIQPLRSSAISKAYWNVITRSTRRNSQNTPHLAVTPAMKAMFKDLASSGSFSKWMSNWREIGRK